MVYLYDVQQTIFIRFKFNGSLPGLNINKEAMGRALLRVYFDEADGLEETVGWRPRCPLNAGQAVSSLTGWPPRSCIASQAGSCRGAARSPVATTSAWPRSTWPWRSSPAGR